MSQDEYIILTLFSQTHTKQKVHFILPTLSSSTNFISCGINFTHQLTLSSLPTNITYQLLNLPNPTITQMVFCILPTLEIYIFSTQVFINLHFTSFTKLIIHHLTSTPDPHNTQFTYCFIYKCGPNIIPRNHPSPRIASE